jgi:hypothetical protein
MNIRLILAMGTLMISVAPRPAAAEKDNHKSRGTKEVRLERKCAHERAKDDRDEERGRRHPRRDNKWDALCAPPPPVTPPPPPIVQPPIIQPPTGGTAITPPTISPPPPA